MIEEERVAEIGRMHIELKDINRELACIDNKLLRSLRVWQEVIDAVHDLREHGGSISLPRDVIAYNEITQLTNRRISLMNRQKELDTALSNT